MADDLHEPLISAHPDTRGRARQFSKWLSPQDRRALGIWGLAYIALMVVAWAAAWSFQPGNTPGQFPGLFEQWDAYLLRNVAEYGYYGPGSIPNNAAFFPGYPLVLHAVHIITTNWVAAQLLVSLCAGAVAMVALARLADDHRAVWYQLCAPASVFLFVGYSESLFLAFAIPAWAAGRRGSWWLAGAFLSAACVIRPTGLAFLMPAMVVMAVTQTQGSRWRSALKLSPALVGPAIYALYLHSNTGSWLAWNEAQEAGWHRQFVGPIEAAKTTWSMAFDHAYKAQYGLESQLEILAVVFAVTLTFIFLFRRQWPEATYIGLACTALATSTFYQSVPRAVLIFFPLYVLVANVASRRSWVGATYIAICGPLAVVSAFLYLSGQYIG